MSDVQPAKAPKMLLVRVFVPFACGYYLSYLYRTVNAVISPDLVRDLGLALLPELALRSGVLTNTELVARPLAPPAPRRTIALVARQTTARGAELDALADFLVDLRKREGRAILTSRGRLTRA